MFGSSSIARTFNANGYSYYIYWSAGAVLPMIDQLPNILDFLDQFVRNHKRYQIDLSVRDLTAKLIMVLTPKKLLKKYNRLANKDTH